MSWTTYHCHTPYCDGQSDMESFILTAIQRQDSIMGFSTHGPVPFASDWNISSKNLIHYYEEISRLKEKYKDKITIYSGIEADYIEGELNAHSETLLPTNLDYKIGSLHYLGTIAGDKAWAVDSYYDEWEEALKTKYNSNIDLLIKDFSRQSLKMMEEGGFDILGHVDKVFQNGHLHFDENYPVFKNCVLEMLHAAKEKDLIVEINTKSYESLGFFYPHQSFFPILKQLNLPITINSDAHSIDRIYSGIPQAAEHLLASGITETVELVNGAWKYCQLTKEGVILEP